MGLTRFDMENQSIARRTARALERIATALEVLAPGLEGRESRDLGPRDDEKRRREEEGEDR